MELYQLEYFRILCKYGNFTSAAEELMVTQPAVSMAVKKLEEEYNVELIDRDSKAFALTPAGETVLRRAVAIHNEVAGMRQDLNAGFFKKREVIRLAIPVTMCPAVLPELLSNYVVRNNSISLNLLQKGHLPIVKGLTDRSIDIGIFGNDFGDNVLLEYKEFARVELYAAFSPEHRFNNVERVTPEMLNEETLIFSKVFKTIPEYIRKYLDKHNIEGNREFHDGYPDDNVRLAQQGLGVVFTPAHIAGPNCAPLSPPLYCDLIVAWNRKTGLTKEQGDLIDFLIEKRAKFQE